MECTLPAIRKIAEVAADRGFPFGRAVSRGDLAIGGSPRDGGNGEISIAVRTVYGDLIGALSYGRTVDSHKNTP